MLIYKLIELLKYLNKIQINSYYIRKGGAIMYYYGNGYNYTGAGPTSYGTPYYPPYGGYNGTGGAWAFALVIFILLIIVGCWCSRNNGICFR